MTPAVRLLGFAFLTVVVATAALWITRESLRSRESPAEIGLRWLKEEYHLDEPVFERITALHRDYYQKCDQMCRQINEADRPLLWRARQRGRTSSDVDALLSKERAICADCEKTAIKHLRQVAAHMPPEQGKRFLENILPAIQQQRLEHDSRVSSRLRR
ncbi:MAG: hypothetical protein JNM65_15085 [Verrucomicrobiaceae bacterium]|nr:hypothetical protein [Verrucomicrobiaceae bacterium]